MCLKCVMPRRDELHLNIPSIPKDADMKLVRGRSKNSNIGRLSLMECNYAVLIIVVSGTNRDKQKVHLQIYFENVGLSTCLVVE